MQHREAAVRITQTVQNIAHQMNNSVGYIYQYLKKGEISEEAFNAYLEKTQHFVGKIMEEFVDPIYEQFPDLRPVCISCGGDLDKDEDEECHS